MAGHDGYRCRYRRESCQTMVLPSPSPPPNGRLIWNTAPLYCICNGAVLLFTDRRYWLWGSKAQYPISVPVWRRRRMTSWCARCVPQSEPVYGFIAECVLSVTAPAGSKGAARMGLLGSSSTRTVIRACSALMPPPLLPPPPWHLTGSSRRRRRGSCSSKRRSLSGDAFSAITYHAPSACSGKPTARRLPV